MRKPSDNCLLQRPTPGLHANQYIGVSLSLLSFIWMNLIIFRQTRPVKVQSWTVPIWNSCHDMQSTTSPVSGIETDKHNVFTQTVGHVANDGPTCITWILTAVLTTRDMWILKFDSTSDLDTKFHISVRIRRNYTVFDPQSVYIRNVCMPFILPQLI